MVLYFEYDKIGEHFNLLKQDFFLNLTTYLSRVWQAVKAKRC